MKLRTKKEIETFKDVIASCEDDVYLMSGSVKYNLKCDIPQAIAIGKVADGDEYLELYASNKKDEAKFLRMLNMNPSMI